MAVRTIKIADRRVEIMNSTFPCIKVNDIETTISWYSDFLGYQCTYKSAIKNPDSAVIEKHDQKIYILKSQSREAYASNVIVIEVLDLKAEHKALEEGGAIMFQDIGEGMFSDREFIIKDYEDNKIIYKEKT